MVKPGINTTELALTVLVIIGNVVAAATGALNTSTNQHVGAASVILAAVYALSRSLVKYGAAKQGGN